MLFEPSTRAQIAAIFYDRRVMLQSALHPIHPTQATSPKNQVDKPAPTLLKGMNALSKLNAHPHRLNHLREHSPGPEKRGCDMKMKVKMKMM